eukprot:Gb_29681 [translate_table: standard]
MCLNIPKFSLGRPIKEEAKEKNEDEKHSVEENKIIPDNLWGKHSRVILDVGYGVANFEVFPFEREVLTMVPWHVDGGKLLLELNRLLRPRGYFVWLATPIYQKLKKDIETWKAMYSLTRSICWNLLTNKIDTINEVGVAIYQKPTSNTCYESRRKNEPPLCEVDDPNAAWCVPMGSYWHKVPNVDDKCGHKLARRMASKAQKSPLLVK